MLQAPHPERSYLDPAARPGRAALAVGVGACLLLGLAAGLLAWRRTPSRSLTA